MTIIGQDLKTHYAPPERQTDDAVLALVRQLKNEALLSWFDAVPMGTVIINQYRQILFCNKVFQTLTTSSGIEDTIGLRPGEALNCVNAHTMEAGCGCSDFCNVCGAANAIIKSLDGAADCQECRLTRIENDIEVPLDLQVFAKPIEFRGLPLSIIFVMDISHEKRLKYLNRTFYHGLINGVGGISTLAEILESGPEDSSLFELLLESSRRTLRDVLYHHDLEAAENGRLGMTPGDIDTTVFFDDLIREECILKNMQESCTEVTVDCDTLRTDKRILGHVVRNMLSNALEASPTGLEKVTLTCRRLEDGRTSIIMTNPGDIPKDIRKQIFKRYVSTKSRDRGLGTYVIKLFTERYLGGSVAFASGDGTTTFEVILPVKS